MVDKGHVTTEDDKSKLHHDFKSFYVQYDFRRGKNFKETFPELADWYSAIQIDQSLPVVDLNDGRITHFESGTYPYPSQNII